MKNQVQAVVIGGGLVGCSILYHLAKLGWTNTILLERDELTSGSTWHAAANIHGLHDNNNITRIQHYTMNLYRELEQETGQGCGVFQPGSLYLAQTEEREHQLRLQEAKAKLYGLNFHEVSRAEAEQLHPLANYDGIRCINGLGYQCGRFMGKGSRANGRARITTATNRAPIFCHRDY